MTSKSGDQGVLQDPGYMHIRHAIDAISLKQVKILPPGTFSNADRMKAREIRVLKPAILPT